MREPWEWIEEDLIGLVESGQQETLQLEFKGSEALSRSDVHRNELEKDVSSFANSAGGTIVYGLAENDDRTARFDEGVDPEKISKEWLEQVLGSGIRRRIPGLRIQPVRLLTRAPGRVAYVLVIPESHDAPHQAAHDKKFYKRRNFMAEPMEEYEIRDLMRRGASPILSLRIYPAFNNPAMGYIVDGKRLHLAIRPMLVNEGTEPTSHARVELGIDERIKIVGDTAGLQLAWHQPSMGRGLGLKGYVFYWNSSFPCFRGSPMDLWRRSLVLDVSEIDARGGTGAFGFKWTITAPKAGEREGYLAIEFEGDGMGFSPEPLAREELLAMPGLGLPAPRLEKPTADESTASRRPR